MAHMHILLPFKRLACHLTKGTLWRPLEAEQPEEMKFDRHWFHKSKNDGVVLNARMKTANFPNFCVRLKF